MRTSSRSDIHAVRLLFETLLLSGIGMTMGRELSGEPGRAYDRAYDGDEA